MNPAHLLYVALGGALGAMCRALISFWLRGGYPWATLIVNVIGSLLIGMALGSIVGKEPAPHIVRWLLATGFCGAFTTFSTFSYETLSMLEQQRWFEGLGNIALNVLLCLAATWIGIKLAIAASSA